MKARFYSCLYQNLSYKYLTWYLGLLLMTSSTMLFAQQQRYAQVKIYLNEDIMPDLLKLGLELDHGEHRPGYYIINTYSENEIQKLKAAGIPYDILIPDMAVYYEERAKAKPNQESAKIVQSDCEIVDQITFEDPEAFKYGSMGGFLTLEELFEELDKMREKYPHLISTYQPIDSFKTVEGRSIYWLRISDNPDEDEADEPELLFDALHHAREPMSLMQMIYFMHYLLENYDKDEAIKNLIDDTEIYFVPCVNPDGYVYNQTTNPNGGGFWRKNVRDNDEDGTFNEDFDGVDLNRNYGYLWGYDDDGSSPDIGSAVYRGHEPFSEPETQAMKALCEQHEFRIVLNYHSYSNLLIYPWSYEPDLYTEDSALFVRYADVLTKENHYFSGTVNQTLYYLTNGDADDWMYLETDEKNKILAMTPEVGTRELDGFWPEKDRILPLCRENLLANLNACYLLHDYGSIVETSPIYVDKEAIDIEFIVTRLGLNQNTGLQVHVEPINDALVFIDSYPTMKFDQLDLLEEALGDITLPLNPNLETGDLISFYLVLSNDRGWEKRLEVNKYYGSPSTEIVNPADSLSTLVDNTEWGLSYTTYFSSNSSFTDSPDRNYSNFYQNKMRLKDTIDLTEATFAQLNFKAKWVIEPNYDYAQVKAIDVETGTETALCGKYTKTASLSSNSRTPYYDGSQRVWVFEEMNLADFLGKKILIEFSLIADDWANYDGIYIDDIEVVTYSKETIEVGLENWTNTNNPLILYPIQPNPVDNNATIQYRLAPSMKEAQLSLYNSLGQLVRTVILKQNGRKVNLEVGDLAEGIYYYQMESIGHLSEMRKMIIVR